MGRPRKTPENPTPVMENTENNAVPETITNTEPQHGWKRNKDGLLDNVVYIYNLDGTVNWQAMIPAEFIVPMDRNGETDISKLNDKQKLILLAGFKKLAQLRGYLKSTTEIINSSPDYVSASAEITWIPNFETDWAHVTQDGKADAWAGNVSTKAAPNGFVATNFLMTIAENRAFVRAVKNFLQITILGQDEVSLPSEEPTSIKNSKPDENEAYKLLQSVLDNGKISFEVFKNQMNKYVTDGKIANLDVESWETLNDIPTDRIFEVTKFLKDRLEEKKKAAIKSQ